MANADRIIELLHEARLRPAGAERDRFLAEACAGDSALMDQVVSLLEAEAADNGSFLRMSPVVRPALLPSEKPGDRIGRYKLLEQIGEGGCGVVYMAEQEEPVRRRVALKVIKLGMDTKSVIARFEAERQALALMDHPNIARVFDAGATDTGRPYFVMELVRGIRITDFCDQHQLSTNERLELFIQVCHAIQHAHQKGIIHRDIKPSNILVTVSEAGAVGCPKVIDFGIAKATNDQRLTDKTVFTAFEQFIGTPAYMSPEQAMMTSWDIDTRTDIYALGVLLYELLTGSTPFDAKALLAAGMDEMRRKIRDEEPATPSTCLSTMQALDLTAVARRRQVEPPRLIHLVRGDLDWLVMKCLEKDRTRRYETANGLAADVRRHLGNEPITARPPSRWYEFQKTVRRHRFGFAVAAALILVLGLGVVTSGWQAIRATRAERQQSQLRKEADAGRETAQTEAAKSRQVAQFMQDMLKGVGPSVALGRDTKMLREILNRTAERIATDLKEQPDVEAELRSAIGAVYWELGEWGQSLTMHSQALTTRRRLFGNEHPAVATSLQDLAQALRHNGRLVESEAAFREALALRRKLFGNEHPAVADSLNYLGSLLSIELKDGEPEALLREALAIRRKVYGRDHGLVGVSLDNLAHVLNRQGLVVEAAAMHYEALAVRRKFFGDQHPELVYSYRNLAIALQGQGKLPEAEAMLRDALSLLEKLIGEDHPDVPQVRSELAIVLRKQGRIAEAESFETQRHVITMALASALEATGKHFQQAARMTEAETNLREALVVKKRLFGDVHREVERTLFTLGRVLDQAGKPAEAEMAYRDALSVERKLSGDDHILVANALHHLAHFLRDRGNLNEAESLARESLGIRRQRLGSGHLDVAWTLHLLAWTRHLQGQDADAETLSREALTIRRARLGNEHHDVAWTLYDLAFFLRDQRRLLEAVKAARESYDIRKKERGNAPPARSATLKLLADLLKQSGKLAEAEAVYREELALSREEHGDDSPAVANARHQLAVFLRDQKRLAEAETLSRETLAIRKRHFGSTHRDVSVALVFLAQVLQQQGNLAEAEAMWREELTMERKLSGDEHLFVANSLSALAAVLEDQGKFAEAEVAHREQLKIKRRWSGNEPPDVTTALAQLTMTLLAQEKFSEAEPTARECLALREQLIPDDWRTFNSRSVLGGSLLGQKKYAEAEPLLLSGYQGMKQREDKIPAMGRPRLKETLQRLVLLYEATRQPEKATEWNRRLAEFDPAKAEIDAAVPKP